MNRWIKNDRVHTSLHIDFLNSKLESITACFSSFNILCLISFVSQNDVISASLAQVDMLI